MAAAGRRMSVDKSMVHRLLATLVGGGYVDQDPETNRWRVSYGGKDAAVEATNVFGSLFRELLVRGYGRGLEMEADEIGRRYAKNAGFPIEGGAQMLEQLHAHIFEDQEYGYWRTHPYFTDRVARARAAGVGSGQPPTPREVAAYREYIEAVRGYWLARTALERAAGGPLPEIRK